MNAGAAQAQGEALVFVHADTRLPEGAGALVSDALQQRLWGRFDVRITGRPWVLRVVAALMNGRSRLTGIATGDQAIFVRRDTFAALGGFPDLPLMEGDIALSRAPQAPWPARLSGRQRSQSPPAGGWESQGPWRTILLMWRIAL